MAEPGAGRNWSGTGNTPLESRSSNALEQDFLAFDPGDDVGRRDQGRLERGLLCLLPVLERSVGVLSGTDRLEGLGRAHLHVDARRLDAHLPHPLEVGEVRRRVVVVDQVKLTQDPRVESVVERLHHGLQSTEVFAADRRCKGAATDRYDAAPAASWS